MADITACNSNCKAWCARCEQFSLQWHAAREQHSIECAVFVKNNESNACVSAVDPTLNSPPPLTTAQLKSFRSVFANFSYANCNWPSWQWACHYHGCHRQNVCQWGKGKLSSSNSKYFHCLELQRNKKSDLGLPPLRHVAALLLLRQAVHERVTAVFIKDAWHESAQDTHCVPPPRSRQA